MSYSKLHASVVNSSLWTQSDSVRLLFITLLAICDRDGLVYGSRNGLERLANVLPAGDEPDPWEVLMSPDPESSDRMRTPEFEGRRIEEVPGGFRLLNFSYYRGLRNDDDRREQNRAAQERFRAAHKLHSAIVSHGQPASAKNKPISEAEAEAEAKERKDQRTAADAAFTTFWAAYPKKVGKDDASKAWKTRNPPLPAILTALTAQDAWLKREGGKFIPNPATWLRQGRWKDEPPAVSAQADGVDFSDPVWDAIVKAGPSKRPL